MKRGYSIGSYKIDLAIVEEKTSKFVIGVEVDGYGTHSGFEKMIKDIERQKFLQAKKYPIHRITEFNWGSNKEKEMDEIFKLLV